MTNPKFKANLAKLVLGPQGVQIVGGAGTFSVRQGANPIVVNVAGDSISEVYDYVVSTGTSVVAPGIARATFAVSFTKGRLWPGDKIKVTASNSRQTNQMDATITAVDLDTQLWIEYTISPEQENNCIGTSPTIYYKYSMTFPNYIVQGFAQAGLPWVFGMDASLGGGDSIQVNEIIRRDWKACDIAFYATGMNDVFARSWSFEQIKANDIANIELMRKAPRLVIMSIPPRATINPGWSAAKFIVWRKVNEWRRAYAASIGAHFANLSEASVGGKTYSTPSNTNQDVYATGDNQTTSDGVHPAGLGGVIHGRSILPYLIGMRASSYLPSSASESNIADGYIIANPMMLRTTGGTATGTATFQNLAGAAGAEVADGYALAVQAGSAGLTVKAGIVPRTAAVHGDVCGMAQRIVIDNTNGTVAASINFGTVRFNASMTDGDKVDYGMHLLTSSADTPGSGDPSGLTRYTVSLLDQHAVSFNRSDCVIGASGGTGAIPAVSVAPIKYAAATRSVSGAGAFTATEVAGTVTVAIGKSACIDIGRVLARKSIISI